MTYEKPFQGAHKFYAMIDNQLITMQYMFCTKKKALQQFKNYIKEVK